MVEPRKLFSEGDVWFKLIKKNTIRIGVSPNFRETFGQVLLVDLPSIGNEFSDEQSVCAVASLAGAFEISLPLAGVVTRVNEKLQLKPELVNTSPCKDGWICHVHILDEKILSRYAT